MFVETILSLLNDIVYSSARVLWYVITVYRLLVEIRFMLQWFININPYFEPFQTLWDITDPFFTFGKKFYPKLFGIELAPMVNWRILLYIENAVGRVAEGITMYNYSQYLGYDATTRRVTPLHQFARPE